MADEPDLVAVVLDEERLDQWEALGGRSLRVGGSRAITGRPSERGDWIIAIYGSAPADARALTVDYGGVVHRAEVNGGVFALTARSATEPELTLTKPRFEWRLSDVGQCAGMSPDGRTGGA